MKPKAVIAGNWKMHSGPARTREFFRAFRMPAGADALRVLVFPPAISLPAAVDCADRDPAVALGVQNIHFEDRGAFTGEISAAMAAEAGATHALVGHSERRHLFGETDADVARKARAALRHALVPVVCVGETLEQRRAERVEEAILAQLAGCLETLDGHAGAPRGATGSSFLLAYEPVWAIGTGETATPADAQAAHAALRAALVETLGPVAAAAVPILYGGSVNPDNAAELLAASEVDGVLVGGASLDPDSFSRIVQAAL